VVSAEDMRRQAMRHLKKADVIIGAAAVGDYTVKKIKGKMKRKEGLTLKLTPTTDIMRQAGRIKGSRLLIGFAAESGRGLKRAMEKMKSKNLDMVVYNDISKKGAGFGADNNEITVIGSRGRVLLRAKGTKKTLAAKIISLAQEALK
jgi:phosphopantothenoylcysteine decarboxylase / phosphopantothenate---cysteine ligase